MRPLGFHIVCLLLSAALVTASKDRPSKSEDSKIRTRLSKALVQHTLAYVGSGMWDNNPYAFFEPKSLMLMNQRMDDVIHSKYNIIPNSPTHLTSLIFWDIKSHVLIIMTSVLVVTMGVLGLFGFQHVYEKVLRRTRPLWKIDESTL